MKRIPYKHSTRIRQQLSTSHLLPVIMAVISLFGIIMPGLSAKKLSVKDLNIRAKQNLADYAYRGALNLALDGQTNLLRYYKLLEGAYKLDGEESAIKTDLGLMWYYFGNEDQKSKALEMMATSYFNSPGDRFLGEDVYQKLKNLPGSKLSDEIKDLKFRVVRSMAEHFPYDEDITSLLIEEYCLKILNDDHSYVDSIVNICNQRLKYDPDNVGYNISIVQTYQLASMNDSARAALTRYEATVADKPDILVSLARGWMMLGDTVQAVNTIDNALAEDSTLGAGWMLKGEIFLAKGDTVSFAERAYKALESGGLNAEDKARLLKMYLGTLHDTSYNDAGIENLMIRFIEENPADPDFSYIYAVWLEYQDRYSEAADYLGRVVENDPDQLKLIFDMSRLYAKAEQYDKSIKIARDAYNEHPDIHVFLSNMVSCYYLQDKMQEIIDEFNRVNIDTIADPQVRSDFQLSMADCYVKLEEYDKSYEAYEKAVKSDPLNYLAMNNYAYRLAEDDRELDKAAEMAYKAVNSDPNNPTMLDTYAWVLFKQIKYPEAKDYIRRALQAFGEDIEGNEAVMEAMADSVATDSDAVTVSDVVVPINGNLGTLSETPESTSVNTEREISMEIYDHAGDIYFMNRQPEMALKYWEKALALEPENKRIAKKVKDKTYYPEVKVR